MLNVDDFFHLFCISLPFLHLWLPSSEWAVKSAEIIKWFPRISVQMGSATLNISLFRRFPLFYFLIFFFTKRNKLTKYLAMGCVFLHRAQNILLDIVFGCRCISLYISNWALNYKECFVLDNVFFLFFFFQYVIYE